ncbi:Clp protease N-terminal domain-containing protein [Rugosimonospora acidiphila]|uniref:Clp protease N-terminal domain-containing protein n=1 Tax=Rugosimonospora acidiphila TaxID=556531 RepID=A0ABP9RR69_9ACTN
MDLTDADPLAKVTEAQQRARSLSGIGDSLIDHFVTKAREAGTSWSQLGEALGVTKQAAQQRWLPGNVRQPANFSRFTQRARHVTVLAQERARDLRHGQVDTEHLLLGLLGEEEGLGAKAVIEIVGSRDAAERAVLTRLAPGSENPPAHIPFTELSKTVLREALNVALEMRHNYIGTEHILLGLLRTTDGKAAELLGDIGVTYRDAYASLIKMITAIEVSRRTPAKDAGTDRGAEDPGAQA